MLTELQAQLEPRAIVVTPTSRLAYYLAQTHALSHRIISLQEWLSQLWENYAQQTPRPWKPLSAWQSTLIWQQIIEQYDLPLLRPQALVTQAQQAWQALAQWQVPLTAITQHLEHSANGRGNNDCEMFVQWAQEYAEHCEQHQWVDEAQLPHFLATHLKASKQHWCLYGFDYITPQLHYLCQQLRTKGAHIAEFVSPRQAQAVMAYYQYPDVQSEWRAAALWAKERQAQANGKQAPIGVVIPELAQHWQKIQRIFTEMLTPEQLLTDSVESNRVFNLDAGLVLAHYPLIADTLLLLTWIATPLPYTQISQLLRSAFWPQAAEEFIQRAQFSVDLARQGNHEFSLDVVSQHLETSLSLPAAEILLTTLTQLKEECNQWPTYATPSAWAALLQSMFAKIAWAHTHIENNTEQQLWQRWLKVLADVATLDMVLEKPICYQQFIHFIQQQVQHICFQPESTPTTIQVMGVLETSGMPFSHLWVCGLHAQTWPAALQTNPFIPSKLQREYGLPHASHLQELNYAQHFTQQWMSTAQELIFSYPQSAGDNLLQPSPLLLERVNNVEEKNHVLSPWQQPCTPIVVEEKEDYFGLPCSQTQGSVRLLQDQAACPFRAYAYHRLGLAQHKLVVPTALGNSMMRGIIVHRALQLIWSVLKNQQQLLALSTEATRELVNNKIAQTLTEHYQALQKITRVPEIFLQVEQQRISALLIKWLEKEKQRQPFTIHRLEHTLTLNLQDITLKMRIDRLDQLADGTFVIMDYKTSKQPIMQFLPERLTQAQLPLYALSKPQQLSAVVFAQVGVDSIGFSGWVEEEYTESLPKSSNKALTTTVFAHQLLEWEEQLGTLASEFKMGYAKVDPYPNESVCRYCDLHLLCGVNQ